MRPWLTLLLLGLVPWMSLAQENPPADKDKDNPLPGSWKFTILQGDQVDSLWLLSFEAKDGSLTGKGVPISEKLPGVQVKGKLEKGLLKLAINNTPPQLVLDFEGKFPTGTSPKKIYGSTAVRGNMIPTILEATLAKDETDIKREILMKSPNDPRVFNIFFDLLDDPKTKTSTKDVSEWAHSVLKSAELYGPRWQLDYSLKLVEKLAGKAEHATLAVDMAKKLESVPEIKESLAQQMRIMGILATAFKAAGKDAEAKEFTAKLEGLEGKAYAEYQKTSLNFEPKKFEGRKGKSSRAVLVELFTGAQCPPCVAADMAFDGLEKAYTPKEVVLLQYHLHIPRPDPLANADADARAEYYDKQVGGTPTILFNGKEEAQAGGPKEAAGKNFDEFRDALAKLLEKETTVKIDLEASRKGDKVEIKAKASGVEKPSEKVRLRIVLVEDWARYKGSNGLMYHHRVVRAIPGGPTGVAMTKGDGEKTVSVDLAEVRESIKKYLIPVGFPEAQTPLRMQNLHVVAFVQDDATQEVLQATEVPVK